MKQEPQLVRAENPRPSGRGEVKHILAGIIVFLGVSVALGGAGSYRRVT